MKRITKTYLQQKVDFLNQVAGRPLEHWNESNGERTANEGHFHLSQAYGGYSLHENSEGGGARDTFRCGHITARDLCNRINAFIEGIAVGWEGRNR